MGRQELDWPGNTCLSGGKWPVGLGHDHFAIAVNLVAPLILGGPSETLAYMSLECVVKLSTQS
jgi:hypothetical protein